MCAYGSCRFLSNRAAASAQVLSRDIRSLHKRLGATQQQGLYHVLLEGVDVTYDVVGEGTILVRGAELGGTGGRIMLEERRRAEAEAAATQAPVAVLEQ